MKSTSELPDHDFRLMIDGASAGVALANPDGTIAYLNAAFTRMLGYSMTDLPDLETWWIKAYPDPDYRVTVQSKWAELAARHENVNDAGDLIYLVRHRDGHSLNIRFGVSFLPDGRVSVSFDDVTAATRLEAELRASEERFRNIFEKVPSIAVQGYASDGEVRYWNPASEQIYGYRKDEAIGRNLIDLIIPDQMREPVRQAVLDMTARGEGYPTEELQLRHKDGGSVPVLSSHVVVKVGGETQLYCLDVSLSDRKAVERALAQRESLLRQVMDTASVAIFLVDNGGRITFANQRMAEMFDCPMEQLLGSEYVDHLHPSEREVGRAKMLAMLASNINSVDLVRRYWRNDHSEFWGRLTGHRFKNVEGTEIGLVGVIADVDERRKAEIALRQSEASERAARQQAEAVLAALPDLLFEIDETGRILQYRAAESDDLYARPEDFVGHFMADFLPPDAYAVVKDGLAQANLHGHSVGGIYSLNFDGETRWFEISVARKQSEEGQRFILLARNVTRRKLAETRLVAEQDKFRDLVDSTAGIVWEGDAKTFEFTFVSQEAERLLGYPVSDWLKPGFWVAHLHPEDLAWAPAFCAACTGRLEAHDFEYRFIARDGRTVWLRDIVKVVAEEGVPRWLRGVMIDVTEGKLATQKYTAIVNSAMDAFITVDRAGNLLDCNEAACRMTGYSREEFMLLTINQLDVQESSEDTAARIAGLMADGQVRFETRWRRKDGSQLEVEVAANYLDLSDQICSFVRDISASKAHERELDHIAHYDALTGIPNRTLLADRMTQGIAQTRRAGNLMAVCYLDLDGFKPVNDQYGHEAGDKVLIEIAARLEACLRGGDTVARMGGDEFVLILLGIESVDEFEIALKRILNAVSEPLMVGEESVTISASLGVAIYPRDDVDVDTLLRHADQSMYLAKQSGKNRYHLFDPEHDRVARDRSERLIRIGEAFARREFVLYYQPQVNMRRGQVRGMEALIRWRHPERGILPPAEFLAVIEDHDLIVEVGDWVIGEALGQIAAWQQSGIKLAVGVNIAARHLMRDDFIDRLKVHLAQHPGVAPEQLDLEVLETAALDDINRVSSVINQCRALGVSFSLDDFGTGYSSLTYLKSLPAETLKIDQTFVRDMLVDPEDRAIVQGVIGLAKVFQREVIAEGVETVEHGTVLLGFGCERAQGYGIARPMPASAVADWIAQWQPAPGWGSIPFVPFVEHLQKK